uniref:rhomboid protease n=1 Tax=Lates calcarifer TaxID=8187 RepID=A0A4W6BHS9_LATCA
MFPARRLWLKFSVCPPGGLTASSTDVASEKLPENQNPGKVEEDLPPPHTESSEVPVQRRTSPSSPSPSTHRAQQAPPSPPRAFSRLFRPLVFTVGFTGCSFGSAAIWQYESVKSQVRNFFNDIRADWMEKMHPPKRGDVRRQLNQWWSSLSEGQRTITGIIAANAVVFCCWRIPSLQRTMLRYFTSNPTSKTLCSPMLLSTFSHFSFFHMAANMYVLWSFSTSAVSMLGREQFLAVYLSAGVISTFVSYVSKMVTGRFGPSLGASGAIMTILAAVCTKMPDAKTGAEGHHRQWIRPVWFWAGRFSTHSAAHLGGAMFGIWYVLFGHELIWKNREPFVKLVARLEDSRRTRRGGDRGGSM